MDGDHGRAILLGELLFQLPADEKSAEREGRREIEPGYTKSRCNEQHANVLERELPGTFNDGVHVQHAGLAVDRNVQALVVHFHVLHACSRREMGWLRQANYNIL